MYKASFASALACHLNVARTIAATGDSYEKPSGRAKPMHRIILYFW